MVAQFHLRSIEKSYGGKIAVQVEELIIWPARLYTLIGPNGSGKSTLLNILAFLTRPEQGEMLFADRRITWNKTELGLLRKNITLLHQSPYLFSGTVFSNVAFGLKVRGKSGERLRHSVAEALALVGLAGFEARNVRQLSGGEVRRVALARSLAIKPGILLLDEPLANMDEESTVLVERLIASLPAHGTTVVMSTHDAQQADRMESDVVQLLDGRLEQAAIRSEPGNTTLKRYRYAHL